MTPDKQAGLGAAGWRVGTVKEFLGLSDAEMEEVERRVAAEMARPKARLSAKGTKIVAALLEAVEGLKLNNEKKDDTP